MRFNPGTIYFVREAADSKGGLTVNVKIGLVEDPRTAQQRLAEHQTGNPRKLFLDEAQLVHTDAVKYVESQLHKTFAPHRISGEWFHFESEAIINDAVALAKEYALAVGKQMPTFETARKLARTLSDGSVLSSTPTLLATAKSMAQAAVTLDAYDNLLELIEEVFEVAIAEEGPDSVEGIYKFIDVYPDPAFSVTAFKAEIKKTNPELIAKYTIEEPKFTEKFELLFELDSEELSEDVQEYLAKSAVIIEQATLSKDYFQLNELKLDIARLKAPLDWVVLSSKAEIQVACGLAAEIEGICTWVRKLATTSTFAKGLLFEQEPELFQRFVLPREATKRKVFIGNKV